MGVEVRLVMKMDRDGDWQDDCAILVCNTSGRVINLPVGTFDDAEQAESFLEWCYSSAGLGDPRKMSAEELEIAVDTWREAYAAAEAKAEAEEAAP